MKFRFAAFLGALISAQCAAQATTFDPATGLVDVQCVAAADSRQVVGVYYMYQVRLRRVGVSSQFNIDHIQSLPYIGECTGDFDTATNIYRDVVNVGDTSYDIRMRREGNVLTLESATLRGPATTSLWVARSGGNTVYLAGTIHVLRPEDYPLPRAYEEAYAKSSALYFEIDMDDPAETGANATPAQIAQRVRDPQGRTLTQVLRPGTYNLLRDYLLSTWGIPIENVNAWSAQMLVNTLVSLELESHHGYTADGVDFHIADRAIADRKPITGLETAASQLSVLQTLDEGIEDEVVLAFLDAVATGQDKVTIENMVKVWRRGDITEIDREHIIPMREEDHADYLLLQANRNYAWLPQIEALLRTPETEMVVVGVAHMAGEDGLVMQLRRRGYHVQKY